MAGGMGPIHAMNDRHALGIGFNLEGFSTVSMCLHLLGIPGLNLENTSFHPLNRSGSIRAVFGQEVEELHDARLTGVQTCPFGRREGLLVLPLFDINNLAEMHTIGWRRRSIGDGWRCQKRTE